NIYVRDRKPFVRFADKAYVLPRTGQRGIPVVSVNTSAVAVEIYRVGDRNLLSTVLSGDFQRNLYPYEMRRLTEELGSEVWHGEMKVEPNLNADVVTAFPITEAVGALSPGVYVMQARAARVDSDRYEERATQWFIVSDRGVSGRNAATGLDAFIYTERGVYRTGETVQVTALLRDPQGVAALGVPLTMVVERPDGVEYRRSVVADQGLGGRALAVPIVA